MNHNKLSLQSIGPRLLLLIGLSIGQPLSWSNLASAQTISSLDRERAHGMLSIIKSDLKKNYYDPSMHGMDLDARFKAADEKMSQATSNGQLFSIIAQAL